MTSASRASAVRTVSRPIFLKSARGDTESSKRQDHGANTDVMLRPSARAPKNRGDGCRSDRIRLKRRVQVIASKNMPADQSPEA